MSKFNTGHIRSVNVVRDFPSTSPNQLLNEDAYTHNPEQQAPASNTGNNGNGGAGGGLNTQKIGRAHV